MTSTAAHKSLHRPSTADQDNDGADRQRTLKKLYTAATVCSLFLLVEVVGGWLAGSLAILSDASHLFADLASFCVAIVASHLASLPSTTTHTFGLRRAESLAALISMLSLAVVSIVLAFEALRRLFSTSRNEKVDGPLMSGIAAVGVLVNVMLALILGEEHVHMPGASDALDLHNHNHQHEHHTYDHSDDNQIHSQTHDHDHEDHHDKDPIESQEKQGLLTSAQHEQPGTYDTVLHMHEVLPSGAKKEENINLKAAYLHVLGDLAQSLAVLVAGVVLWIFPKAQIVDPLCTLLFCILVFYSTLSVLRSSVAVLLEEIPPQVDWVKVYDAISAVPDVSDVHDLHIWCISHGEPSLSVHCVAQRPNADEALKDIFNVCRRFGILHATIQLQSLKEYCITCSPSASLGA